MDLQRTLKVLEDIQREDATLEIQKLLTQLRDLYTQNPDGDAIPNALSELVTALSKSVFNEYTPSNLHILESIDAAAVNGNFLTDKVEAIVQRGLHPKVVAEQLSELVKERKQLLQEVTKSIDGLRSLGLIKENGISEKEGEVGIKLPSSLTQDELSHVTEQLEDWNALVKQLHELCGEGARDAKISSVSNGSIWVFFQEPLQCLALLAIIINQLAAAALKLQEIQDRKNAYKDDGLSATVIKELTEFETGKAKKSIEKIVDEIFQREETTNNYPNGDQEEAKARLRHVVNRLAKSMQNGLTVEVKPPKPPADLPENATDDKIKKHRLINEQIATVRGVLGVTRDISKGLIDFSKVLLLPEFSEIDSVTDADAPTGNDIEEGVDDVGGTNNGIA
jgi:uncharacterized protein YjgD (DUF1641 family)